MSRYTPIDDIVFTDKNNKSYSVKDFRPIPVYETLSIEKWNDENMVDEFISRNNLYGEDSEDLSYTIIDHNKEKIVENDFDFTKIKQLRIPVIDEIT